MECSHKLLDLRSADGPFPFLRLQINSVEAESILVNESVNSFVPGFSNRLARLFSGPAVTHSQQEFDNKTFEKLGGARLDSAEKVRCEIDSQSRMRRLKHFFWR